MIKEDILKELKGLDCKVRFYKVSPYQKRRFKPEYVGSEAWIYNNKTSYRGYGYMITEEDYNNEEYRGNFFDMIREEAKQLT